MVNWAIILKLHMTMNSLFGSKKLHWPLGLLSRYTQYLYKSLFPFLCLSPFVCLFLMHTHTQMHMHTHKQIHTETHKHMHTSLLNVLGEGKQD